MRKSVFVIAEAGVNHNGSLDVAFKLVDAAVEAGADAVKFQTFSAERLVSKDAMLAEYQRRNLDEPITQYEMLKKLELSKDAHKALMTYCRNKGILFCSTAFDVEDVLYLHSLNMPFMKSPSGEITNLPYLRSLDACRKPVLLSTGMATLEEVAAAVAAFKNSQLTLLHCTTEYPCPYAAVNLNAMITLREKFGFPVGYSDHTLGIDVPIAAVAMGASVIEKHLTLDRDLEGPDHKASLVPSEFKAMVSSIRRIEDALGDGEKEPSTIERKNIVVARKSIVARTAIKKGDVFSEMNLTTRRPGNGMSPMEWDRLIGTVSKCNYCAGQLINE